MQPLSSKKHRKMRYWCLAWVKTFFCNFFCAQNPHGSVVFNLICKRLVWLQVFITTKQEPHLILICLIGWSWSSVYYQVWLLLCWNENLQPHQPCSYKNGYTWPTVCSRYVFIIKWPLEVKAPVLYTPQHTRVSHHFCTFKGKLHKELLALCF